MWTAALAAFILILLAPDSFAMESEFWTYTRYGYTNDDRGSQNYLMMYNDLTVTNIIKDRLEARFSGWLNIVPDYGANQTVYYDYLRVLQDGVRDVYATLSSYFEELGVSSNICYYVQPQKRGTGEDAISRDFSHYGQIFNASYPFQQAGLQLQKYTGEKWIINGGAMIKRLIQDSGIYSWSNVDSNLVNAGLTRLDLFIDGLDVTVLGNYVQNKIDRFFDVTGEIDYKITKELSAAFGMTYTGYQHRFDLAELGQKVKNIWNTRFMNGFTE
ncbi:MAG: hypothetical protein V1844_14770 [Pseudomonadota bacterium]